MAGGRNASLTRALASADVTSRASGKWGRQLGTRKSWGLSSDELFLDDDNPYVGDNYVIEVDTDGQGSWEALTCRSTGTLTLGLALADKTSTCSGGWAEAFATRRTWSISTELRHKDPEAAGSVAFKALQTAYGNKTALPVRLKSTAAGLVEFTGEAHVTQLDISAGYEEAAGTSLTITGNGALVKSGGATLSGSLDAILTAFFATEPDLVTLKMTTDTDDNTEYVGSAWPTSFTFGFGFESEITAQAQFTGDGELEVQTTVMPT